MGMGAEKHFRKPPGTAADFEHIGALVPVQQVPARLTKTAARTF